MNSPLGGTLRRSVVDPTWGRARRSAVLESGRQGNQTGIDMRHVLLGWIIWTAQTCIAVAAPSESDLFRSPDMRAPLAAEFDRLAMRSLNVPPDEIVAYAAMLRRELSLNDVQIDTPQFVLLVDRSPFVQAALLFWGSQRGSWALVGAVPVSTGKPGSVEHFATPVGVYEHSLDNMDFRAEGTYNALHIRGYGAKGARVFDFGWVTAPKGWGDHDFSVMRLQLHATDPDVLEPRLGTPQSKGCIRISGAFNRFLDAHGVLDAAYDEGLAEGGRFWVLRPDRTSTPWAGRWLVVVDSDRRTRPGWCALPKPGAVGQPEKR